MNAPGWQPDPTGRHDYRYWDGSRWTDDVSDAGATSVDPIGGGPPPPTEVQPHVPEYGQPYQPYDGGPSHMGPSSGGSGPSTGLLVALGLVVLVLVGGIVFVLLSGSDDDDDDDTASSSTSASTTTTEATTTTTGISSEEVVDQFATAIFEGANGEFTEEQARCMAEGILDTIGLERLAQVQIEAGDDGTQNPVDLLTPEEQEAAFDAMRACVPDATIDEIPT
jgi:hypothetical protein